jgi:hypothetical protein
MVNGGWIAGHLASLLGGEHPVEVSLRAPTPLDERLDVLHTGSAVVLARGEDVLVTAVARPDAELVAPEPVSPVEAEVAGFEFAGFAAHPFPDCFTCGHHRAPGRGQRLFTGTVPGRPGTVAGLWSPPGEGTVPVEHVWGALDCPTGWAHAVNGGVALLGRITARQLGPIEGGGSYVVVAEAEPRDGRKLPASGAVWSSDGELLAVSRTVWIDVTGAG